MTASLASADATGLRSLTERGQVLHGRIRDLHPSSFAFVIATGILSSAELRFGASWLFLRLLIVTVAGYAILCLLFLVRLLRFRRELWADTALPERAFGFPRASPASMSWQSVSSRAGSYGWRRPS